MDRDSREMKLASQRALIQRLNVLQYMFESVTACIDFVLSKSVKHERVIRVRGMSKKKIHRLRA
jgi:hypothetical protein